MNYPLIALVLLHTIGLGAVMATHGQERKPTSFYYGFLAYVIEIGLLYLAFK
jgi:hypothetical protein